MDSCRQDLEAERADVRRFAGDRAAGISRIGKLLPLRYGDLQGLNKAETAKKFGEEQA